MTRDAKIVRAMTDALTLLRIGGRWTASGEVWVLMLAGAHFGLAYRSRVRKLPNVHLRLNADLSPQISASYVLVSMFGWVARRL